jgi:hypothetical protein
MTDTEFLREVISRLCAITNNCLDPWAVGRLRIMAEDIEQRLSVPNATLAQQKASKTEQDLMSANARSSNAHADREVLRGLSSAAIKEEVRLHVER